MRKIILIVSTLVCFFLIGYGNLYARVSGPCANCHTMHNSQNGSAVAQDFDGSIYSTTTIPKNMLLIYSCLGCHSNTIDETIKTIGSTRIPIVFNTVLPSQPLAGGNFYWVKEGLPDSDDTKGHNVFLGEPDDILTTAPGTPALQSVCLNPATQCHANLSAITPELGGRQGCTKCHMMRDNSFKKHHHADDSNTVVGSVGNDEDAFYRFLQGHMTGVGKGVSGIEDDDWQQNTAADNHNEYLGKSGDKSGPAGMVTLLNTMTGFCCGCHGNFHVEQNVGGAWVRHPSDAVIPDRDEYADAYGVGALYDPQVPVARPDLTGWTGPSATVAIGTDMVMCLSCHRAHGSPYPDMLRWDYSDMVAGDDSKSGGCFTCHTQKNQP